MLRILTSLFLLSSLGAATALDVKQISIGDVWSRATPQGSQVAVGYVTIENKGQVPERLTGFSTDRAGRTELHEMSMNNGIMEMRQVKSFEILPQKSLELKPGGAHLMFLNVRTPFKEGETFKVRLNFEKAGPVEVDVTVKGIGAKR